MPCGPYERKWHTCATPSGRTPPRLTDRRSRTTRNSRTTRDRRTTSQRSTASRDRTALRSRAIPKSRTTTRDRTAPGSRTTSQSRTTSRGRTAREAVHPAEPHQLTCLHRGRPSRDPHLGAGKQRCVSLRIPSGHYRATTASQHPPSRVALAVFLFLIACRPGFGGCLRR